MMVMRFSRLCLSLLGLFLNELVITLPGMVVKYEETSRARLFLTRSSISSMPRLTDHCFCGRGVVYSPDTACSLFIHASY